MTKLTPAQKKLYDKLTSLQKHCANAFILGKSCSESYLFACKKIKKKPAGSPRNAGHQIITKTNVAAYIRSIKEPKEDQAANDAIMQRDEMLARYTQYARGSIANLMEFQEGIVGYTLDGESINGQVLRFKDSADIAAIDLDNISEISVSEKGAIRVKIEDRQKAQQGLRDMQGMDAAQQFEVLNKSEELTPWDNVVAGIDD